MPNDYLKWRLGQGFTLEQSQFLFDSIDASNYRNEELETWMTSNKISFSEKWNKTNKTIMAAQESIHSRQDLFSIKLLPRLHLTLPRIQASLKIALYGGYYEALVLLRSAIEGFLRFTLDLVYEFRFTLAQILSNLENDEWKNARKIENALAIGPMCNWLKKMGIAGNPPFTSRKNLYKYLEIEKLNHYTHSNVIQMIDRKDGEFSKERFDYFVNLYSKTVESFIIVWQNLSDKIDHESKPIVQLGPDFEETDMPLLAKLIGLRA